MTNEEQNSRLMMPNSLATNHLIGFSKVSVDII